VQGQKYRRGSGIIVAPGNDGCNKSALRCIKAFRNRFYGRSKAVDVPLLVMHGEDDQIVPFPLTGARAVNF